jgi:hypothetical protein
MEYLNILNMEKIWRDAEEKTLLNRARGREKLQG